MSESYFSEHLRTPLRYRIESLRSIQSPASESFAGNKQATTSYNQTTNLQAELHIIAF